jgi:hypothetical protein
LPDLRNVDAGAEPSAPAALAEGVLVSAVPALYALIKELVEAL